MLELLSIGKNRGKSSIKVRPRRKWSHTLENKRMRKKRQRDWSSMLARPICNINIPIDFKARSLSHTSVAFSGRGELVLDAMSKMRCSPT
jgi:hypothetical protein